MNDSVTYEERAWWIAFKQGDAKALHQLYERYFDRLYNYAFKFCRDQHLVEDAIQELFLKLMRTRENLAVPDSVQGYMLRSFRMMLMDKLEQHGRRKSKEDTELTPFDIGMVHDRLADKEAEHERYAKLNAALSHLTDRQREAVFLRYFEELPYPQIADMLEMTQKAAYKLIGRAISTLREAAANLPAEAIIGILIFVKNFPAWLG